MICEVIRLQQVAGLQAAEWLTLKQLCTVWRVQSDRPGVIVYLWRRHLLMASEKQLCGVRAERGLPGEQLCESCSRWLVDLV